jgi:hypothetical protein
MEPIEAQIAKVRDEVMAAVGAAPVEVREKVLVDLLILLHGVAITNQDPGLAHAGAREVANSAIAAALSWLKSSSPAS